MNGVMMFRKEKKLILRFIRPFDIPEKVGDVAYRLALLSNLLALHSVFYDVVFYKFYLDNSHVMLWIQLDYILIFP